MKNILVLLFGIVNSAYVCCAIMQEKVDHDKLILILKDAYQRDQAPRVFIDSLMRNGVTDGNLFLSAINQQREADSININVVLPIIDSLYKFGIYNLDPVVYKCCWIIIQHADVQIMLRYVDFVEELKKRDLISANSYMAFIDRIRIYQEKAQIYGYQFKRFSNGILIQFPILKGVNRRWKELGCNFNMSDLLPAEYNVNYYGTEISKGQFVILGFLYEGEKESSVENIIPLVNTQIFLNKRKRTCTDANGFFKIVMSKKEIHSCIEVLINGVLMEYKVVPNENKDFSISIGYLSKGEIEVVCE